VQDNAACRPVDPDRELDQSLAQRGDLGVGAGGAGGPAPQLLKEGVRGQHQQDAQHPANESALGGMTSDTRRGGDVSRSKR
jgi:hypothetical protein